MRQFSTMLYMVLAILGLSFSAFAETTAAQRLLDNVSPSIVTINSVIKIEMKAGGQSRTTESRFTTEGVVVSSDGLIMISSAPISSDLIKQMMGFNSEEKSDLAITPTSFKIVIEHEQKEYTAILAAKDTVFSLAFLQITDLANRKLTPIDFTSAVNANIGDEVACIARLSKAYDYAPVYQSSKVCGMITKPRNALMLDGSVSGIGLPVFTEKGEIIGVLTLVSTSIKDDQSSRSPFQSMSRFFSMDTEDNMGMFLVQGAPIAFLINEAKKQALDVLAKHPTTTPGATK